MAARAGSSRRASFAPGTRLPEALTASSAPPPASRRASFAPGAVPGTTTRLPNSNPPQSVYALPGGGGPAPLAGTSAGSVSPPPSDSGSLLGGTRAAGGRASTTDFRARLSELEAKQTGLSNLLGRQQDLIEKEVARLNGNVAQCGKEAEWIVDKMQSEYLQRTDFQPMVGEIEKLHDELDRMAQVGGMGWRIRWGRRDHLKKMKSYPQFCDLADKLETQV